MLSVPSSALGGSDTVGVLGGYALEKNPAALMPEKQEGRALFSVGYEMPVLPDVKNFSLSANTFQFKKVTLGFSGDFVQFGSDFNRVKIKTGGVIHGNNVATGISLGLEHGSLKEYIWESPDSVLAERENLVSFGAGLLFYTKELRAGLYLANINWSSLNRQFFTSPSVAGIGAKYQLSTKMKLSLNFEKEIAIHNDMKGDDIIALGIEMPGEFVTPRVGANLVNFGQSFELSAGAGIKLPFCVLNYSVSILPTLGFNYGTHMISITYHLGKPFAASILDAGDFEKVGK